jgi:hypothetical protein
MSRRAEDHARRLIEGIEESDRRELADNPLEALEVLFGYEIDLCDEHDIGGGCSVAGSFDPGPPPRLTVVRTASTGRRYFTALHEHGHPLVAEDATLQDLFPHEPDQGVRLEEEVCDAIAATLLLPDQDVARFIGDRGPTARAVLDLFHDRRASREACCVRAAQRIIGPGYVMLARDGVARFTASANTVYRVRRGTLQPADHPIRLATGRTTARAETPVYFGSGAPSSTMFMDAVADDDGWVFGVFVESNPAWISGPAIMAPEDVYVPAWAYCPHCEVDFEGYGRPCPICGGHRHKRCGKCACVVVGVPGERYCEGCFQTRPPADWSNGSDRCDICVGL